MTLYKPPQPTRQSGWIPTVPLDNASFAHRKSEEPTSRQRPSSRRWWRALLQGLL